MDRSCWMLSWLLCLVPLAGCRPANATSKRPFADPDDFVRFASLPMLSATHDSNLRDELARLVTERATPTALGSEDRMQAAEVASELRSIFPTEFRSTLSKRLAVCYPPPGLRASPLLRREAAELLTRCEEFRRGYQRVLMKPDLPRVHEHRQGMGADLGYLDVVEFGNHLEACHVGQLLDNSELSAAREPLAIMANAVEWLAREKHPLPRMAAVERRAEWLAVVHAVANHSRIDSATRAWLLELVDGQLRRWPPDADAWLGERAQGLHTYELVRDGYLLSLLSYDELQKYRDEVGIKELGVVINRNVDADEWFYLRTLRKVVDGCSQPYFMRRPLWVEIESERDRLRDSDSYPFVADKIILVDMLERHRLQALDRARCEAWRIALTASCGLEVPQDHLNPLTGAPFAMQATPERITVGPIDPDDALSMISIRGNGP